MPIHLSDVEAAYGGGPPVLRSVDLSLETGWTGIVGENGAGKSTLLALLEGSLLPSSGERRLSSVDATIVFVPQQVHLPGDSLVAYFEDWTKVALAWRSRLGLEDDQPFRWSSLSFGERKRWQLAAALARSPDVLLVDEPTNHLDQDGAQILFDALRAFPGAGVVVSHDRRLLDGLTRSTVEVRSGRVRSVALGYTEARAHWDEADWLEQQEAEEARAAARREVAAHQARVRGAAQAEAQLSTRSRMKGKGDSDARSAGARARVAKAAARSAQQAGVARTRRDRAMTYAQRVRVDRRLGGSIHFDALDVRGRRLLSVTGEEVTVGERVLVRELSLTVDPGERIAILGANGTGKSTVLRRLVAACALPPEDVFHLPQELTTGDVDRLVEDVLARPSKERGAFVAICAALGIPTRDLLERRRLSPGEARKAAIADALGRRVAVLFLDEPTNHLDLPSIERLGSALASYAGAVVLVTHDLHLVETLDARRWTIPDLPITPPA